MLGGSHRPMGLTFDVSAKVTMVMTLAVGHRSGGGWSLELGEC